MNEKYNTDFFFFFSGIWLWTLPFLENETVIINATLVPDSITGTGDWMLNPIPSYASDYVACDYVVPNGTHCDWKCPGCGAPWYAADTCCPCQCAEQYPQYFPSGKAYVGADPKIFLDPLPGFMQHTMIMQLKTSYWFLKT